MNRILVAKPVATFDGVVHMPAPVVFSHVAESGVDAALGGDGVGACREELGDAGGFEAGFGEADGGTESSASSSYHDGIVVVVNYGVFEGGSCCSRGGGGSSSLGLPEVAASLLGGDMAAAGSWSSPSS